MRVNDNRRGFLVTDALTALILITSLAAALAMATAQQNRAARRLADEREAIRLAERALDDLQAGAAPATRPSADAQISIRSLDDAAAPKDYQWVIVSASVRGRGAEMAGLVPRARP